MRGQIVGNANTKRKAKYEKENITPIPFKVRNDDVEVLEKLEEEKLKGSRQGYILGLIREDIRKGKN